MTGIQRGDMWNIRGTIDSLLPRDFRSCSFSQTFSLLLILTTHHSLLHFYYDINALRSLEAASAMTL